MGSAGVAALVAHLAFWILVLYRWLIEEQRVRAIGVPLALWVAGFLGLPYLPYGEALFPSYVAVLDIALLIAIVKDDVSLR